MSPALPESSSPWLSPSSVALGEGVPLDPDPLDPEPELPLLPESVPAEPVGAAVLGCGVALDVAARESLLGAALAGPALS